MEEVGKSGLRVKVMESTDKSRAYFRDQTHLTRVIANHRRGMSVLCVLPVMVDLGERA